MGHTDELCLGLDLFTNSPRSSKWKADSKSIKKLALNHSETKLATAGHTINIWDLATKKISKVGVVTRVNRTRGNPTSLQGTYFAIEIHRPCKCYH